MYSGRLACAPRVSLRALPLALAAAFALTCPPSTFATECRDVRTGRTFTVPSARYTSSGASIADEALLGRLCVGALRATHAVSINDGADGAFVIWIESAGEDCDVHIQHVGPESGPESGWPEGGRILCRAPGSQTQPAVAAGSAGRVWASWRDYRDPSVSAVYLSQLDATGVPVAGFAEGGVRVSDSASSASDPVLLSDGTGGAWLIWQQGGPRAHGLWLTHFSEEGALAPGWPPTGKLLTPPLEDAVRPRAVSDSSGGLALAWVSLRSGEAQLRLLRLDATGTTVLGWPGDGIHLATSAGLLVPAALASVSSGLLVAWSENFEDSSAARLTRVGREGALDADWPSGGRVIGGPGNVSEPTLTIDGADGAYLAWIGRAGEPVDIGVKTLRVTSAGETASGWPAEGLTVANSGSGACRPRLLAVEDGVLVTWSEGESVGEGTILSAAMARLGVLPELDQVEKWPDLVRLSWRAKGETHYTVLVERRQEDGEWAPRSSLERDTEGKIVLEDREVAAGDVIIYRLRLRSPELELVTGEVQVEVPAALPLAIRGLAVQEGRLRLIGSIPTRGESRFELFDVQGRRLLRDVRRHEHAGELKLDWPVPDGIRAGVFFARLTLGRETKARRFVLGR